MSNRTLTETVAEMKDAVRTGDDERYKTAAAKFLEITDLKDTELGKDFFKGNWKMSNESQKTYGRK